MKTIYLFHGWGGSSQNDWFPWLKNKLEESGFKVVAPDFPDTDHPNLETWLDLVKSYKIEEKDVLVGHSMAGPLIFSYLEQSKKKVGNVYLVSAFDESLGFPEHAESGFFEKPYNWTKIKKKANTFFTIYSDDDKYINLDMFERVNKGLKAKAYFLPKRGHFLSSELVELFSLIKEKES